MKRVRRQLQLSSPAGMIKKEQCRILNISHSVYLLQHPLAGTLAVHEHNLSPSYLRDLINLFIKKGRR